MTTIPPLSPRISHAAAESPILPPPAMIATPKAAAEIFSQRADCNPTLPPLSNTHETTTADDALLDTVLQFFDQQLHSASSDAPTQHDVPSASLEGLPLTFISIQLLQNSPHEQDKKHLTDICLEVSKEVNMMLKDITLFFKNLLAQEVSALTAWMAVESKSENFTHLRPFFTSNLLQSRLTKLTSLRSHLSDELIKTWSYDYPACVTRLQEAGLAIYNEQAPAEPEGGFFDSLKSFAGGSLHAMEKAVIEASNGPIRQGLSKVLVSMCKFDEEVIRRTDDPAAIIAFIEKMKHQPEEYTDAFVLRPYFFLTLNIMQQVMQMELDQRDIDEWQELDLRCVSILYNSTELKLYLNEPPLAEAQSQIEMLKANMKAQYRNLLGYTKKEMRPRLQMDIETLKTLLSKLEQEPVNCSEIELFLKTPTGIFTNARMFEALQWMDKEFFESTPYDTHYRLFKLCCSKLIELKFQFPSLSLKGMHSEMNNPSPAAAPPAAAKSVKGPAEQLKEDSAFLVELLKQEDTQVEDWLTKHDVAAVLLRGKQFRENIKTLLTQVDRETVRKWREQYMACVEKLGNDKLKLYGW